MIEHYNRNIQQRIINIKQELKKNILLQPQKNSFQENIILKEKIKVLTYGDKPIIKMNTDEILFTIRPGSLLCGEIQVAYYLFRDMEHIDTKWYSENYTYRLDTKKYGSGKYRIQYFIVEKDSKDPGAAEKLKIAYSDDVEIE